jgi:hypothetical protein
MRLTRLSWTLLVLALFLVGYGMAAYVGGDDGDIRKAAVAPTDVTHVSPAAVEGSETVVMDSSDCFTGGQLSPTGTTAQTSQVSPAAGDATTPASGDSGSDTDVGTSDAPVAESPAATPPAETGGHPSQPVESACPRPQAPSEHP